jgi:hypothetical protein
VQLRVHPQHGIDNAPGFLNVVLAREECAVSRERIAQHARFVGFGIAAKNESDELSVTRFDFAEQLGMRFRFPGNRAVAELTLRHWSNGGIRLPNHGQDLATLTVRRNFGDFGVDRADWSSPSELVKSKAALVAANYRIEGTP